MNIDTDKIKIRRGELESEIARQTEEIARLSEEMQSNQSELDELLIAERVIARLSGRNAGETRKAAGVNRGPNKSPTIRQMIAEALMDARQRGLPGLTPQGIREYIREAHGRELGQQVNTTASRMWRDVKEIDKDTETGLFRLFDRNSGGAAPEEAKTGSAEDTPGFHFPEPSPPRAQD